MKTSKTRPAARPAAAPHATHRSRSKARKSRSSGDGFSFARSCAIAFALGLFSVIGLNAVVGEEFTFQPIAEASAAPSPMELSWAIDTNGDGVADIANPVEGAPRGTDYFGSGAFGSTRDGGKRKHQGVDYAAAPGHKVTAPISGVVKRVGFAYKKDARLTYVEIANAETGYSARVLYVSPAVAVGQKLAAGEMIGTVQDLSVRYAGITNHVHVEVRDPSGSTLDTSMILPDAPIVVRTATQAPPRSQGPA